MAAEVTDGASAGPPAEQVADLLPLVRRVVRARMGAHPDADDMVQEALARVLAARDRVADGMLEAYAITTVRNLLATKWRHQDRDRRHLHRLLDLDGPDAPDTGVLAADDRDAMALALTRLSEEERELLLAHEVERTATTTIAAATDTTPGAVAARLARLRARLRVEYLIALESQEPPTEACRPVLLAFSARDRRRQRENDAERHLLECAFCAVVAKPLLDQARSEGDRVVPIATDSDVVVARQLARAAAAEAGFDPTSMTLIATAVSEIARNIVKFAGSGQIVISTPAEGDPGVQIVARDTGPGIPDIDAAMRDGYSTYGGLGLGLSGARRLMDEFDLRSAPDSGTTITMIKRVATPSRERKS